jgi:hypothetical protein
MHEDITTFSTGARIVFGDTHSASAPSPRATQDAQAGTGLLLLTATLPQTRTSKSSWYSAMTLNSKRPTVPQRQNTDDTQRKDIDDAQEQAVNPQSGTTCYPAVVSFANSDEGAIIHTYGTLIK